MTGDGLQVFSPSWKPNYTRICPDGSKVAGSPEPCSTTIPAITPVLAG
jgi:hypothetical protein